MSKKSRDDRFRKIDVDKYDEDKFHDDEGGDENDHAQFSSREGEVKKLITSSNLGGALTAALKDPPVSTKDDQLKVVQSYLYILLLRCMC